MKEFGAGEGGYDSGYLDCPCFWGSQPGSLVQHLVARIGSVRGWKVLDAGTGEGKNAFYLAELGASVVAVDVSAAALRNARAAADHPSIEYIRTSIQEYGFDHAPFDLVVAYGLLHCLPDEMAVRDVLARLLAATRPGGYVVVCAFNDRSQDLTAHPGFSPCLLPDRFYREAVRTWDVLVATDQDLHETHPHNDIPHSHSLTRIIARKPE